MMMLTIGLHTETLATSRLFMGVQPVHHVHAVPEDSATRRSCQGCVVTHRTTGPGAARNPGDVLEALSRGPVDERVKCRTCRTSAP